MNSLEPTANQRDAGKIIMFFAYMIIVAVVLYSDGMFIKIMWDALPNGFVKWLAIGGAFATGLSIIMLVFGKQYWFHPGLQMLVGWAFCGVEVMVAILNTIVSFEWPHLDAFLSGWMYFLPATPFVALVGWILLFHFDSANMLRHLQREIDEDNHRANMLYQREVNRARNQVQLTHIRQVTARLKDGINAQPAQAAIDSHATSVLGNVLSDISGRAHSPTPPQMAAVSRPQIAQQTQISLDKINRKLGRKSTRAEYVEQVKTFEQTGAIPPSWGAKDDFARYVDTHPISDEERGNS